MYKYQHFFYKSAKILPVIKIFDYIKSCADTNFYLLTGYKNETDGQY